MASDQKRRPYSAQWRRCGGIVTDGNTEKTPQLGAAIVPLVFTKGQAADMLNLTEGSIEWLLRKRAIPHHKIAGKIRFTRADLEALIEASAVTQCCATVKESEVNYE